MNKKLYYIANIRMPTEKAHGIQIMKMCEAFAELGQEVELIVPKRKTHILEDPYEYYGVKKNFTITRVPTLDLIRWGRVGFLIQAITFSEAAAWYLLLKEGIFYTRDEIVAFFLKSMGKRVVWEVHMGQTNVVVRLLLRLRVPLIVITNGLKKLYVDKGVSPERILVAHDGVDLRLFQNLHSKSALRSELSLPQDKKIIAYIGKYKTLGQSKGAEDIIVPFRQLLDTEHDAHLLFVGTEKEDVETLVASLAGSGIPESAYTVMGHVSRREVPKYMKAVDVLVMTYPNTPYYAYYMSPLKLFEYMASGTVILSSRLPSIEEVLDEDSAFFYTPGSTTELTEVLKKVFVDPSLLEQKSQKARVIVEHYTWHKRAQAILIFIETSF